MPGELAAADSAFVLARTGLVSRDRARLCGRSRPPNLPRGSSQPSLLLGRGRRDAEQAQAWLDPGDGAWCVAAVLVPGGAVEAEPVFGGAAGVVAVDQVLAVAGVAELAGDLFGGVVAVDVLSAGFFGAEVGEGEFQDGGAGFGAVSVVMVPTMPRMKLVTSMDRKFASSEVSMLALRQSLLSSCYSYRR